MTKHPIEPHPVLVRVAKAIARHQFPDTGNMINTIIGERA